MGTVSARLPDDLEDELDRYTEEENFAQKVYQFQANQIGSSGSLSGVSGSDFANSSGPITDDVISPDPGVPNNTTQGVSDGNNTISNDPDLPAGAVTIPAGRN